jgi:hypothetical protein
MYALCIPTSIVQESSRPRKYLDLNRPLMLRVNDKSDQLWLMAFQVMEILFILQVFQNSLGLGFEARDICISDFSLYFFSNRPLFEGFLKSIWPEILCIVN